MLQIHHERLSPAAEHRIQVFVDNVNITLKRPSKKHPLIQRVDASF